VDLARQLGDDQGLAEALFNLTHTRFAVAPDPTEIGTLRDEALALAQKIGDERLLTRLTWSGGYLLMSQGRIAEAEQIARETLPRSEALGDEFYIALAASALGGIAFMKGDLDGALELGLRGLLASHAMGDVASITLGLEAGAAFMSIVGLPADAVTIDAAYQAHCQRYGVKPPLDVDDWLGLGPVIEEIRTAAASGTFDEEARLGASMTTDGVLEYLVREAIPRFKARRAEAAPAESPA
jgi:tetratricopeptide (TPR) repeat protein